MHKNIGLRQSFVVEKHERVKKEKECKIFKIEINAFSSYHYLNK